MVGHCQGTTHALRLSEQRVCETVLFHQLVWLPIDKFSRGFDQITPCEDTTQLGCIVS